MLDFQLGLQYRSGTGSRWLTDKEWGGGKKKKKNHQSFFTSFEFHIITW